MSYFRVYKIWITWGHHSSRLTWDGREVVTNCPHKLFSYDWRQRPWPILEMRYKSEMMHIVHICDARVQVEEKRIDKGLSFCRKMYHCVDRETTLIITLHVHHILLSMINSQTQEIMANKKSSQPSSISLPSTPIFKGRRPRLEAGVWRSWCVSLLCDDDAGPRGPVCPVIWPVTRWHTGIQRWPDVMRSNILQ